MARPHVWLALLSSLLLPCSGCTKDGEASSTATNLVAPEGGHEVLPAHEPVSADPALVAAVAAMPEAALDYPMELDPLLDLVPAGSSTMLVVRDVVDLLTMVEVMLEPVGPVMRTMAAASPGERAKVTRTLDGVAKLGSALRGPDFALDKGLVLADVGGELVVIYGASKPDALPRLLRSLDGESEVPGACKAVDGAPGYAACTQDAETLAKYAPGKDAAALRAEHVARLDARLVDRANVLLRWAPQGSGSTNTVAIATTPGVVHVSLALDMPPGRLGRFFGTGPSPALGLVAPGNGFYWLAVEPEALVAEFASADPVIRTVAGVLSGEIMVGAMVEPTAAVILAGVTDSGPIDGLMGLASAQADKLPKTLPDGSRLAMTVETLTLAGQEKQVLHFTLSPSAETAALIAKLGLEPEGWVFAAGGYMGVALGAGKEVVEKIAGHTAGLRPEGLRGLPKPLAQALVEEEVALAIHLPLDGYHSPQVLEMIERFAPATEDGLPPGMTPLKMAKAGLSVMSPVSSVSAWVGSPKQRLVVHAALSLIGDPRTEEGRAALATLAKVRAGSDPAVAWSELATRHAGSARVTAYETRAGQHADAVFATAVMFMVLMASTPAFGG